MSFLLAHLSDIHIGPVPRPSLSELMGKRVTGYINWMNRRARFHDMGVLERLVVDMAEQRPDHVAVTGDLVNIGLPAEFAPARRWLETLGAPADVSFTPGNHDVYVRSSAPYVERLFAPWTSCEDTGSDGFPFLRRRSGVALIGLSSAAPTAPFVASGRLGPHQRRRLAMLLDRTRSDGLVRVVLLHHPPHWGGARPLRGLDDAHEFEAIIAQHGAELVLHGHNHKQSVHRINSPDGFVPVVGVASASAKAGTHDHRAAYNLFWIERREDGIVINARSRGIREDGAGVVDLGAIDIHGLGG